MATKKKTSIGISAPSRAFKKKSGIQFPASQPSGLHALRLWRQSSRRAGSVSNVLAAARSKPVRANMGGLVPPGVMNPAHPTLVAGTRRPMAWTCQMLSHQGTENVSQQISCNAHCREVWLRVVYCFDRRCCSLSRRTADGLARWALGCVSREDQVGVRGGGESWLNRERPSVCCVKCLLLLLYAVFRGLSLSLANRAHGHPGSLTQVCRGRGLAARARAATSMLVRKCSCCAP